MSSEVVAVANEEEPEVGAASTALDKYKVSHRTAGKSWDVPPNFPEQRVLDAYANPSVDSNKNSFTFHKPDVAILRGYCLRQFNWDQVILQHFLPYRIRCMRCQLLRCTTAYCCMHRSCVCVGHRFVATTVTAMHSVTAACHAC